MKHIMYNVGNCECFVHTHGRDDAATSLWSNALGAYVRKEGRGYAAMALRKFRKRGIRIERRDESEACE